MGERAHHHHRDDLVDHPNNQPRGTTVVDASTQLLAAYCAGVAIGFLALILRKSLGL